MKLKHTSLVVFCAMSAASLPGVSLAATPTAMLEKSQSYAHDNVVRAFRVPTRDVNGKIKFFDVTIELSVRNNGTLDTFADVTATPSTNVVTGVIPPGRYRASDGTICDITNMTLTNGRIQSFFDCTEEVGTKFELSAATGPISNGHPYLAFLKGLTLDKLTDSATYTWGRVTNGSFDIASCGNYSTSYAVGAKTNGSKLNLTIFGSNASQRCQATLTKQ
jgi:hypothetical protein